MSDSGREGGFLNSIEEGFIALLMFLMTTITFAAVVAREMDSTILWAYEATKILFAWLVLIGASYAVKVNAHLGVDVILNALASPLRRVLVLLSVVVCIAWAVIFVWASFDYWWPFVTKRAWYELSDIPMPGILQWMADVFNEGERYEKMPRFIAYAVLPISALLLLYRFVEAGIHIVRGTRASLIVSHEAEEMIEEVREREAQALPAESLDPRAHGDRQASGDDRAEDR